MNPARKALERAIACIMIAVVFSTPVIGPTAGRGAGFLLSLAGFDGPLILA